MDHFANKNTLLMAKYTIAAFVITLLFCPVVFSQSQMPDVPFPTNMFEPAPGPLNFMAVESPEIGQDLKLSVGSIFSFQYKPFVILACNADGQCGDTITISQEQGTINAVKTVITADILAGFNFLKRFQAGLALPLYIVQTGQNFHIVQQGEAPNKTEWLLADDNYKTPGVVGDIRLHLKARIWGKEQQDGVVLSAAIIPTLPMSSWTGQGSGNTGSSFLTVTAPQMIAGYRYGSLRVAANVGFIWREKEEIFSTEIGNSIKYGLAGGYSFIPQIEIFGELYGSKSLISKNFTDLESAPMLFLGGGRFKVKDFVFNVAAGGGVITGIGVPQFQAMLGFMWVPTEKEEDKQTVLITELDIDGDGIDNDADECPNQPEDIDDFKDEDGCPDNDNDNDGIADGYDSCPNQPEDIDNFKDDDGCPDLDHDEDGIKEPNDKCPEDAEDYDEFEDEDGCPEPDNDNDGFKDASDYCPNLPEDIDNFQDEDGCPDLDNDNDGVPDKDDKCPSKAETLNGKRDTDGCPDKGKILITVSLDKIELKKKLKFAKNSDKIKGKKSYKMLKILANILKGNTAIRISIEGHTDARGNSEHNRELSKSRAEAIKNYLVTKGGIDANRLETVGWGPDQAIASNKNKAGRAKNRRVEFIIIKPEKTEITEQGNLQNDDGTLDFTEDTKADDNDMDFTIEEKPEIEEVEGEEGEDDMDFTME